jgi:hypothetical protein
MIPTLTAILVSGQLAYASLPMDPLEQSTYFVEKDAYVHPSSLPEKKEIPRIPEYNKYFIRMEELCVDPCLSFTSTEPMRDYQQRLQQVRTNRQLQYLSRHQSLRIARENRNHSWKTKPDTP